MLPVWYVETFSSLLSSKWLRLYKNGACSVLRVDFGSSVCNVYVRFEYYALASQNDIFILGEILLIRKYPPQPGTRDMCELFSYMSSKEKDSWLKSLLAGRIALFG